jgi:isoleucyl-tRNA synthetase
MPTEYYVNYKCSSDDGNVKYITTTKYFDNSKDYKEEIALSLKEEFKNDPNFKLFPICGGLNADSFIDKALVSRMRAVRTICEVGRRVRASAKINNRQPLKNAIIAFNDEQIQNYMIYCDRKLEFSSIIADELNVDEVIFAEGNLNSYFNYDLKPNFRSLGPKGYGKQAQLFKDILANMSSLLKNELYNHLKNGGSRNLASIDAVIDDIEATLVPKSGYSAESDTIGAVILNTSLTPSLLERGFVAEFKSAMQNIRKLVKLDLSDKIYLEIFCEEKEQKCLLTYASKWKHDLQVSGVKYDKIEMHKPDIAHKLIINDKTIFAHIWKEEI